jgi:hypothetical protein
VATAEEWRALAVQAILALLAAEGAATQPEMEAKITCHRPCPDQTIALCSNMTVEPLYRRSGCTHVDQSSQLLTS